MKKHIFSINLFICLITSNAINGQSGIEVTGFVKSQQGALQGAQVDFLDINDNFISNSVSGPNGKFSSDMKVAMGKTIKIKVAKEGYENSLKVVKVEKGGNVGEFMLKAQRLAISGFVKDSVTEQPLPGTEVLFYDQSRLIQSKSTNSMGYFDIETDFVPGQKITVRLFKKGYYDKEQTTTFTSNGINRLPDIMLPEISARGLRVFIRVQDKKKGNPIKGVMLHYFDNRKSSYLDVAVPSSGELELKFYQPPGISLDFQITKPKYRTIQARLTLSENPLNNVFTYELEKTNRKSAGSWILIAAGISALLIAVIYGLKAV